MLARSIHCEKSVGFDQIEHQNASARDITDSHYTKIGRRIIDFPLGRLLSALPLRVNDAPETTSTSLLHG